MSHRLPRPPPRCSRCTTTLLLTIITTMQMLNVYLNTNVMLVESVPSCSVDTRRQHLMDTCRRRGWSRDLNTSDATNFWRLLVDDEHHVLYCVIPKVACSSFKTFMVSRANQSVTRGYVSDDETQKSVHGTDYLNSVGLSYLSQPHLGGVGNRLLTYHAMVAVRHPFDRLVSAYKDKFLHHNAFPALYGPLFQAYYGDALPYDKFGIIRPTFSQFLGLIVNFYHAGFRDNHWLSYYDLCHPCDVTYDAILKLETLGDDLAGFTARFADASMNESFPILNTKVNAEERRNNLVESSAMFADVQPAIINSLLQIYEKDFELFGYSWTDEFGAGCDSTKDNQLNKCC